MSKMDIECIRSLKKSLAHEKDHLLEDIITLVNPSLGEKVLLLGNIKNIGKYLRKMGAEVKILQDEDQVIDTSTYLLNESCEFISANLDNIPFKDEYFDKVNNRKNNIYNPSKHAISTNSIDISLHLSHI